jgi:hypothetical protein
MASSSEVEAHGALIVKRLKSLAGAGYVPELKDDPGYDSIDLKHPRESVRAISLWPDGQVVDLYPTIVKDEDGRIIIQPEDERRFRLLISDTPKPNFKERLLATTLGEAAQNVTAWFWVILIWFGLSFAADKAWHFAKGLFGH